MRVYLGLGTNLGDKESNLHVAVRKINERIGEVTALSAFYVTAPWGFSSENSFLNAACCVESVLPPLDILRETQEIERELGRMKKSAGGNYSDRLMTERRFVMDPLAEIASDVVHPVLGKRLGEL